MRIANWHPEVITADVEKKAMDRLEEAGEFVANRARQKVPVLSGKLRDSIRVVRLKGDPRLNVRVYAGNRKKREEGGAFYAHMIEFGTVKMTAKPFLRPAFNECKGRIKDIVQNG
jgi:HK97 gp10 family phage protein